MADIIDINPKRVRSIAAHPTNNPNNPNLSKEDTVNTTDNTTTTDETTTTSTFEALREDLARKGVSAKEIEKAMEVFSEYLAEHDEQEREGVIAKIRSGIHSGALNTANGIKTVTFDKPRSAWKAMSEARAERKLVREAKRNVRRTEAENTPEAKKIAKEVERLRKERMTATSD